MKKIADVYGGLNFGKYFILLPFISTASRTILMHSLNFIKKSCLEIGSCCSSLYGNNNYYYVASSVSGQDESNPALGLATRAGKIKLSCPLGTTRRVPQETFLRKPYNKSFIDQACSVKMAGY